MGTGTNVLSIDGTKATGRRALLGNVRACPLCVTSKA